MEGQPRYAVIGLFVLLFAAGLVVFAIWKSGVDVFVQPDPYHILVEDSVAGLQVGSTVRYKGVPVGEVAAIEIDPEDIEQVRVRIEIAEDIAIREDAVATLGIQGITGTTYIQLNDGTHEADILEPRRRGEIPVIPYKPSPITELLDRAPEVAAELTLLAERTTRLLSRENLAALSESLENIRASTADGPDLVAESRATLVRLREGAVAMESLAGELTGSQARLAEDLTRTLARLRESLARFDDGIATLESEGKAGLSDIRAAAAEFEAMIAENRPAIRDFSQSGLYDAQLLIDDLRELAASLQRVVQSLEEEPGTLFLAPEERGVTVE